MTPLEEMLKRIDGMKVTFHVDTAPSAVTALAERIARELSKPGGPQIASRAIADR